MLAAAGLVGVGSIALTGTAPVVAQAHRRGPDPGAEVATAWADLSLTLVKNHPRVYDLLRPVTYRQANVDPNWLPQLVTPPFPEHPPGHSVQSGAAFKVLSDVFGSGYAFTDHTHDERGLPPRRFRSFRHAADEAAVSRLYGGIQFGPPSSLGSLKAVLKGERPAVSPCAEASNALCAAYG